jgi:integrase
MAKIKFTAARVASFRCPQGKAQAFLWDADQRGLGLRVTAAGRPAFVFQSPFNGRDVRVTIGSPEAWSIPDAQAKARELQRLIDEGRDPRELKRMAKAAQAEQVANAAAAQLQAASQALTVHEAWSSYIEERRPFWGDLHYRDHVEKAKAGGEPSLRRGATEGTKTQPGPLAALMPLRLSELDSTVLERWAAKEAKVRPSSARLALRLLTVFLNWCSEHPKYTQCMPVKNPAKFKKVRETLGKPNAKSDVLTREMLPSWFAQVRQIQNPVIAAALQVMLLTGARPGEVLSLRWNDIDFKWRGITIRDKVEGAREVPLTPYVCDLLSRLPRRNDWVFPSVRVLSMDSKNIRRRLVKADAQLKTAPQHQLVETSGTGRITMPNTPHTRACNAAGIDGLTLHGLRRSFATLTEWLETPTGVVAQIQGHKPSATAEKHYKRRPLDLLRLHHERIEAWILVQAGISFEVARATNQLRAI